MRLGLGLSSPFMGRFLKSVWHLFCQGGHLCSSIITLHKDTGYFFSICSALRLDSIHSHVRLKEAVWGKKKTNKNWRCVKRTLRKMKQKAALLFGILGDIPWEYKFCPLFLAKMEQWNGWNTNVAEGQGWVAGMRWKYSVAENYRKLSWLSRFIEWWQSESAKLKDSH